MSPTTSTVHAQIGGAELTVNFSVIPPSSITVVSNWDELGTANPNGTTMRAKTSYQVVVRPTNVSFGNVTFRENVSPDIIHWPSGLVETNAPQHGFPTPDCSHLMEDTISSYFPTADIFDGTNYVNFSYSSTWMDQYQNDSGNWVDFQTRNITRKFNSNIRTFQHEHDLDWHVWSRQYDCW
jgi:hypothetical protein